MNKPRDSEWLLLEKYAPDILASSGMKLEKSFIQHGDISCFEHSVSVACMSIRLADIFRANIDEKSMVRGALLHDYFLYDWHITAADKSHRLHGFLHAARALENAERDFKLNPIERDVIAKHMFPMNPKPPRFKESLLVTLADKICASREVLIGFIPRNRHWRNRNDICL
jgi:Predicted HD superfamily hydrolase